MLEKLKELITPELSEGKKMELANHAQMDLINMAGGAADAGVWIDANGARFRELIDDPQSDFYKRLANKNTHDEALEEIKGKLYH